VAISPTRDLLPHSQFCLAKLYLRDLLGVGTFCMAKTFPLICLFLFLFNWQLPNKILQADPDQGVGIPVFATQYLELIRTVDSNTIT